MTRPLRFIPARAGNTADPRVERVVGPVHPRSRGEHGRGRRSAGGSGGSSPLARGTRHGEPRRDRVRRFIPARAGNTSRAPPPMLRSSVHPRSRGEHPPRPCAAASTAGSSPLARGTPRPDGVAEGGLRFIPARAGNTSAPQRIVVSHSVHPRSRGEHTSWSLSDQTHSGSSPLARGTPGAMQGHPVRQRFIPARAGNTPPRWRCGGRSAVHPRSRGEHSLVLPTMPPKYGSSPLARGTLPLLTSQACSESVHPRSRGEHFPC